MTTQAIRLAIRHLCAFAAATALVLSVAPRVEGASSTSAPPLPAPSGNVVNVSTESQLQSAISNLTSNTTIVLAPGTYTLSKTLWINGSFSNVTIRGGTNNRDDVVLVGRGMSNASYGSVEHGIWAGGNVQNLTIANLTIRDVYYHLIMLNAGVESPRIYNVRLINAGEQLLKSNPDGSGGGVDNGVVEYSAFEYSTTARDDYTNGVDVHTGANWIIRHNLFRNITAPGALAGPAILMWNKSSNTLTEGNTFSNCARGVTYGLQDISGTDHSGGIIRNNFFHRTSSQDGDNAIGVFDSPNTQVLNNTIYFSGTYSSPIEVRFSGSTGVVIRNNILDGSISGGSATVGNNVTNTSAGLFVDAAGGDLHLAAGASSAIDKGAATSNVTDDWDGQSRTGTIDIGADEYGGGSGPTLPGAPSGPSPSNGATGAAASVTLSWSASGATSYDVKLGTANPPGSTVSSAQAGASYAASGLTAATTYYWQIVARNAGGSTTGSVWSFTTQAAATPPNAPASPSPSSGASNVSTAVSLSWSAGGATSYDVKFGTSNPPPTAATNRTSASYAPSGLVASTTYYWQIVARNAAGTTTGAVWSLTTAASQTNVAPNFTTQPASQAVGSSQAVTLNSNAAGTPAPSYQWQRSTNSGSSWSNLSSSSPFSGVTTKTLNISSASGLNGHRFRVVATNTAGSATSQSATLTVTTTPARADLTVYRAATGMWYSRLGASSWNASSAEQWGLPGDVPQRADFDGDGLPDLVVFRPGSGEWFVRRSTEGFSRNTASSYQWGLPGDVPMPADYDGDGKADLAVFRPSSGHWFLRFSATQFGTWNWVQWGLPGDQPLRADIDGDGKTDLVVYRPTLGNWYVLPAAGGYQTPKTYQWGLPGDIPVPSDYDGDGKTDLAVHRPVNGTWYVRFAANNFGSSQSYQWGLSGDIPVTGDFDSDGKSDLAVWRVPTGMWYLRTSSTGYNTGAATAIQWGLPTDQPLSAR